MKFRAQEVDPVTGVVTEWYVDEHSDKVLTRRYSPGTDHLIERNRAAYNDSNGRRWGDGRVAASVPREVFEKHLWQAVMNDDQAYLRRFLNDPDNRAFRTFKGNV